MSDIDIITIAPKQEKDSFFLKRKGIFKITNDMIRQEPQKVMEVLREVLIVGTENDFISDILTYKGYSSYFDVLNECEVIPEYLLICKEDENRNLIVEWKRI